MESEGPSFSGLDSHMYHRVPSGTQTSETLVADGPKSATVPTLGKGLIL